MDIPVDGTVYTVTVGVRGAGSVGGYGYGINGGDSSFDVVVATGGGGGCNFDRRGKDGGSGGGSGYSGKVDKSG